MKFLTLLFLTFTLFSCSQKEIDYKIMTDKQLYEQGNIEIKKKEYDTAINTLSLIETNYPYSNLVSKSWINLGYSYYISKKYTDAISVYEKFLKFHPTNKLVPYVKYMIAMSYYDQMNPINKDQTATKVALKKMLDLEKSHPNSVYAKDVKAKISIAFNALASKEMIIAKTLMNKKNIIGALNRYQTVITDYDKSIFTPEALFRIAEIYYMIEEPVQSQNIKQILIKNYPNSSWSKKVKVI